MTFQELPSVRFMKSLLLWRLQLNERCLEYATGILNHAAQYLYNLVDVSSPDLAEGLATTTFQGTSNILQAATQHVQKMEHEQARKVVTTATETVRRLLQVWWCYPWVAVVTMQMS